MEKLKNNKKIKMIIQFSLGLLCGYLMLMSWDSFHQKRNIEDKPVILETVISY